MNRKYFPFDKNYLLERAQLDSREALVIQLIDLCKSYYLSEYNPLGIIDSTVQVISEHRTVYEETLEDFYSHICGIYRYIHGENQLELLFDGSDHYNKYKLDWELVFYTWVKEMFASPCFLKAVLELSVFYPRDRKAALAANRMKAYLEQHFSLRLYKHKGIVEMKIA